MRTTTATPNRRGFPKAGPPGAHAHADPQEGPGPPQRIRSGRPRKGGAWPPASGSFFFSFTNYRVGGQHHPGLGPKPRGRAGGHWPAPPGSCPVRGRGPAAGVPACAPPGAHLGARQLPRARIDIGACAPGLIRPVRGGCARGRNYCGAAAARGCAPPVGG